MSTVHAKYVSAGCQHWPDNPDEIFPGYRLLADHVKTVGSRDEYGGGYFVEPRCYTRLRVMSDGEAKIFSDILNHSLRPDIRSAPDGFVNITDGLLRIDYSEKQIQNRLASLKAKGFIETEYHSRQRWIRIDIRAVDAALQKAREKYGVSAWLPRNPSRADTDPKGSSKRYCSPSRSSLLFVQTTTSTHVHRPEPGPGPAVGFADVPLPDGAGTEIPTQKDQGSPPQGGTRCFEEKEVPPPPKGDVSFKFKKEERNEDVKGMNAAFDRPSADANPEVTDLDRQHAKLLHEAVLPLNVLRPGCKPSTWPAHFAKLRTLDKKIDAEVCEVFAWYLTVVGKDYMPEAWSGSSFREKFEKIKAAMEKDRKKKPVLVLNLSVSAEAKKVADTWLTNMTCSGRDVTKLYPLVELTIQGWRTLLRKLHAASDKTSLDLFDKLKSEFRSPEEFARAWWVHVEDVTSTWGKWNGDLKAMTFRPDHWAFKRLLQTAFPDDRGLYSKLTKKLEELK